MGKWPKKQDDRRALEPRVHQEGRDHLTVWIGASHLSLGLSLPSKPLFPRARPPLTCRDQRQGRGLLFQLPFLIQSEENRPIPEPHTALQPSLPGSGPPHRPHTMGGGRPGEGPWCRIVDLDLEGTLEMLYILFN